jgi:hypothetical protein
MSACVRASSGVLPFILLSGIALNSLEWARIKQGEGQRFAGSESRDGTTLQRVKSDAFRKEAVTSGDGTSEFGHFVETEVASTPVTDN